jgi:hypothetical protein
MSNTLFDDMGTVRYLTVTIVNQKSAFTSTFAVKAS